METAAKYYPEAHAITCDFGDSEYIHQYIDTLENNFAKVNFSWATAATILRRM
jgi:short-subunit dehydrogenase involved in D-alanine esterification of teichoic acids